jgi:hypothetical protein
MDLRANFTTFCFNQTIPEKVQIFGKREGQDKTMAQILKLIPIKIEREIVSNW